MEVYIRSLFAECFNKKLILLNSVKHFFLTTYFIASYLSDVSEMSNNCLGSGKRYLLPKSEKLICLYSLLPRRRNMKRQTHCAPTGGESVRDSRENLGLKQLVAHIRRNARVTLFCFMSARLENVVLLCVCCCEREERKKASSKN